MSAQELHRQFRTLLDLPAEIRTAIYRYAFFPRLVLVSVDRDWPQQAFGGKIRFEYFEGSDGRLDAQQLHMSHFLVSKAIQAELSHLLFTHTTWDLGDLSCSYETLRSMPPVVKDRIRNISIRLDTGTFGQLGGVHRMVSQLQKAQALRILTIRPRLADFKFNPSSWDHVLLQMKQEDGVVNPLAAQIIFKFAWQDMETRIPFFERDLSMSFWEELHKLCGAQNARLRWVATGEDRYAGVEGYLSVSGARRNYPTRSSGITTDPILDVWSLSKR